MAASLGALLVARVLLDRPWPRPPDPGQLPPPVADSRIFHWSGSQANQGLDPYTPPPDSVLGSINLNPPISLPVFQGLALLPLDAALWLWWGLNLVAVLAGLGLFQRLGVPLLPLRLLWVLASGPFLISTLATGQIYGLLFLVAAVAWWGLAEQRSGVAGAALAVLIAIKPSLAPIVPALLLARAWRPAVIAGAGAGLLTVAPLPVYGWPVYDTWLRTAASIGTPEGLTNYWLYGSGSLLNFLAAMGLGNWAMLVAVAGLAAASIALWRARPPKTTAALFGLVAGLLMAPVVWPGYLLLAVPGLLLLHGSPLWTVAAAGVLLGWGRWLTLFTLLAILLVVLTTGVLRRLAGTRKGLPVAAITARGQDRI